MKRILMILVADTDPDHRGDTASQQFARFAAPYYLFCDAGLDLVLATREGGSPWTKPDGAVQHADSELMRRFKADRETREALSDTLRFDQIETSDFAGAFCVGAPERLWRHPDNNSPASIIASFLTSGKPVAIIPGMLDLAPFGADSGLLIVGGSLEAPGLAARALLTIVQKPSLAVI